MNGYEVDELSLKLEVSLVPKAPAKCQYFFQKNSESFEAGGFCDNFVTKEDQGKNDEARETPTSLRYLYECKRSEV